MGRKRRFLSFLIALLICCPAFAAQRTDRLDLTGGSTSAGKLDFYEDTDDGTNKTRIMPQAMAADITLTLPADDGDANSTLVNDGSGGLSWSTNPTLGTLAVNTEVYDATGWNSDLTVPTKDAVRDKIEALGGNVFQTTSNVANLVTSTDNLTIGSSTNLAKVGIDGDADEVQLLVQANATQTSNLAVFENSAGTDLLTISNTGVLTVTGSGSGSLTVGNGASSSGMIDILEDTDAGSNYARFQVPSLSANTVYTLPADDGDADQVLSTNGSGTLDWVTASGGGTWDAIGDSAADGSIAQAGYEQDFTSTLDSAGKAIWTITNTDADTAAETSFIDLVHNDGSDAEVIYLEATGDADGTPSTDYKFGQTAALIKPALTITGAGNQSVITEGLVTNNGAGTDEDDDTIIKTGATAYEFDAGAATFTSTANDAGWTAVDQTDNQACTTGCTSACLFGVQNATGTAVTGIVSCSDATADTCMCMGSS